MTRTAHNDGGPAFAGVTKKVEHGGPHGDKEQITYNEGMTLRDWFAGQALVLAHADYAKGVPEYDLKAMFGGRGGLRKEEIVAAIAARYADAMIAERSK
jgi:hypothetical protein